MTRHIRKLNIKPRALGLRAGLMRGVTASDLAFDAGLATVRLRGDDAGLRQDIQALRDDFGKAEQRFLRENARQPE